MFIYLITHVNDFLIFIYHIQSTWWEKNFHLGHHFTIWVYLFIYLLTKILGELIVGPNKYNLGNLICFVTSQKFKSELHKNIIFTERFITEPNLFWANLKSNNFA